MPLSFMWFSELSVKSSFKLRHILFHNFHDNIYVRIANENTFSVQGSTKIQWIVYVLIIMVIVILCITERY